MTKSTASSMDVSRAATKNHDDAAFEGSGTVRIGRLWRLPRRPACEVVGSRTAHIGDKNSFLIAKRLFFSGCDTCDAEAAHRRAADPFG